MTPDEKHFYLRRLHSLSGVIPVGIFLIQHMYGNVLALWGGAVYDEHAKFITHQPLIYLLEIGTVFLPLAFHAGLGIYFMVDSKWNPNKYPYARNWGYTLQRITAFITLFYVVFHVLQTRFGFSEAEKEALYGAMQNLFVHNKGWLMAVYALGAIAASYHLCNGLFTFSIVWGITVSRGAQNTMWRACMGLFVVMSLGFCASLLPLNKIIEPPFANTLPARAAGDKATSTYPGEVPKPAR